MVAIKLEQFGGMIPAADTRLLPPNQAELSRNAWLYSGNIDGFRKPVPVRTLAKPTARKAYRIPKLFYDKTHIPDSYWLEFDDPDTDVVRSPSVNDTFERFYWASNQSFAPAVPQYNTKARIAAGSAPFTLGVPTPIVAPGVSQTGGTGIAEVRAYVYTWVTAYGEESAPSPATVFTGTSVGAWSITMTAPGAGVTTNRNITAVRLYRTVTSSAGTATYYFVAEQTIATTAYSDATASATVTGNNILQSTYWGPPPSDLSGMASMPNGMVVGFRANEIWFCEPYRPHAWPVPYVLVVEFPIVGIGVVGQTVIVCTTASPYAISGVSPNTMTISRISVNEPCLSRGSIISTQSGVVYASSNGLAVAVPGAVTVLTHAMITKDKWLDLLYMETVRGVSLDGSYYCWGSVRSGCFEATAFENSAFLLDDYSGAYSGAAIDMMNPRVAVTKLANATPLFNTFTDHWTGEIFLIYDGKVNWLDISNMRDHIPYLWRSKKITMPNQRSLEAMRVFFDTYSDTPTQNPIANTNAVQTLAADQWGLARVYADDRLVFTRELRKSGDMFRLPSGFKATYWQVEIEGQVSVSSIEMATSAKELGTV
jgi:hypothetical protein